MGVTTAWGTVLKGHSIRKIEKHYSKDSLVFKIAPQAKDQSLKNEPIETIPYSKYIHIHNWNNFKRSGDV